MSRLIIPIVLLLATLLGACGSPEERAYAYVQKAQEYFEAGDLVKAKIEAMNAAQIEPRNVEARFLLAQIEEKDQNFRQAIGHLQVAVASDPNHLESRIKLANYYVLAGAETQAIQETEAAIELSAENPEVLLLSARVQYMQQDTAAARKEVDKALELDPKFMEAFVFKAGLLMNDGDPEGGLALLEEGMRSVDADDVLTLRQVQIIMLRAANRMDDVEQALKDLVRDYPETPSYALSLARLYASQDRIDEAEGILRAFLARDPEDPSRRIGFARFVAEKRGADAAAEVLREFIAELPEELSLKLALGRLYEAAGSTDEAIEQFNLVITADAKSTEGLIARNRMAIIRIQQDDNDAARQIVDQILEDDGSNVQALLVDAAFKFTDQEYDDAISALRVVLREDEASQRALLLLARSHIGAGNPELAQDAYRRLLEINPQHPDASSELAQLLARGGDISLAEDVLRERLAINPDDRRATSGLVQTLLLQGELVEAESQVRGLLEFDDPTGLAEFQLGLIMQAKKSGPEALAAFKRALKKNPAATQPLQGLVASLVEEGRSDEAIEFLNEHINRYPDQLFPKYLMGSVYERRKEPEIAARYFEEVIAGQPANVRAYAALANLYPGDADRQIEIFQRGLKSAPGEEALSLLLATQFEQQQRFDEAMEIYEEILVGNPENNLAANNLAVLLLDQRSDPESHARALELATRFTNESEPALVDTLGWAYFRNGELQKAIRFLEMAVAGADGIPLLHYHLGMAYYAANDPVAARPQLERAIIDPDADYVGADEARATLQQLIDRVSGKSS